MTRIPLALTTDRPDGVLHRIRTTEGQIDAPTTDRLTTGLRFKLHDFAERDRERQAAAERRDTFLMTMLVILAVLTAIGLGVLAEGLWTLHIESLLANPRVIL